MKMFLVLRKSSIKRTLALATLLIMVGLSLSFPNLSRASESNLYYLYPYPSNNPAQSVLFWSESNPEMGAYNLGMWSKLTDKQIVIGLPEGYQINSAMIGNNLGKYITARIGRKITSGGTGKYVPRDSITYEREITPDGIKEKVKVEIGEHFKDNDNFERYLEALKKNLTNKNELPDRAPVPPEIPAPDNTTTQAIIMGGTFILGGLALLAKVMVFCL